MRRDRGLRFPPLKLFDRRCRLMRQCRLGAVQEFGPFMEFGRHDRYHVGANGLGRGFAIIAWERLFPQPLRDFSSQGHSPKIE